MTVTGPGHGAHALLELQDRQERFTADSLDPEPGTCQDVAVLALDPVIERDPHTTYRCASRVAVLSLSDLIPCHARTATV